ncbi:MAG: hypothetical protein WC823_00830 [Parcubacteria group bacterium]|jgi:hypothetical protein
MQKIMRNKNMQKALSIVGWKALSTLTVVVTAGLGIWAMAAFTEPTSGPAASVQDFAKNILGANNADNGFDSSAVVANADGSIVERMEKQQVEIDTLKKRVAGPTALSALAGSSLTHSAAATYCRNLSATAQYVMDGSDTTTTYTDWRLPTVDEAAVFEGAGATDTIWTATPAEVTNGIWIRVRLSDGYWANNLDFTNPLSVRCVR